MSYFEVRKCRACSGTDLTPVFDLGRQPLANNFCVPNDRRQGFYPLKILYCQGCGLAQLSAVVDRDTLYKNYAYVSSSSATMQRHYDRLFKDMESEVEKRSIIEIGSNNGSLLQFAQKRGFSVFGIDPAQNLAAIANENKIPTLPMFFDRYSADAAHSQLSDPGIILARHVFAHIDDWQEFVHAIGLMASKDTLICIEVPCAADMLRGVEFDTVYHEHLSYVTLRPVVELLKRSELQLHRINHYGIHGGSLLLMLRRKSCGLTPHLSVEEMLAEESVPEAAWRNFAVQSAQKIEKLKQVVQELREKGKVVSAFGASAKCTVLLNACGFTKDEIAFVTDNTPLKPGKLIPGTDIPVIEEGEMLSLHPNHCLMTCWNFRVEVLEKMQKWSSRGGKWLIPGKELEIV